MSIVTHTVHPNLLGKVNTALQMVYIGGLVLLPGLNYVAGTELDAYFDWFGVLVAATTMASGATYVLSKNAMTVLRWSPVQLVKVVERVFIAENTQTMEHGGFDSVAPRVVVLTAVLEDEVHQKQDELWCTDDKQCIKRIFAEKPFVCVDGGEFGKQTKVLVLTVYSLNAPEQEHCLGQNSKQLIG